MAANFGGGSTVNANGTVSAPSYNIQGANYNNVGGALNAVNNSLSNLQSQVSQSNRLASAGTALALAASGLRYDDRPGKISTAIGAAGFHGQGGVAGGLGWTSDDGKWRANVGVSLSPTYTRADAGVNGGLSFTWN